MATRKFDIPEDTSDDTESVSNGEHIIDQASGLKSVAVVADKAAELARANLQRLRDSLFKESSKTTQSTSAVTNFSDSDVSLSQRNSSQEIVSLISDKTSRIESAAVDIVKNGMSALLPIRDQNMKRLNSAAPEIEFVSVEMNKKKGSSDCFYSRIVFNLPRFFLANGSVKAVRIFRAEFIDPNFSLDKSPLSLHGLQCISSDDIRVKNKVPNQLNNLEKRLKEDGVENSLDLIKLDPFTNQRLSATSIVSDGTAVDRSVSDNLNFVKNQQLSEEREAPIQTKKIGAEKIGSQDISSNVVVRKNNGFNFKELAFLTPDKIRSKVFGNAVQFVFEDETISYGRSYKYYVVSVDSSMSESSRSKIVEINVDGLRIPDMPSRVYARVVDDKVLMNISVEDQLVEKFEVYRKESDTQLVRPERRGVLLVSSNKGFPVDRVIRDRQQNGFIQIAEVLNGIGHVGSNFFDLSVSRGRKYTYRVYSVDIFGNKSEMPREIDVYVPRAAAQADRSEKAEHAGRDR
jgi:hypothetical protein